MADAGKAPPARRLFSAAAIQAKDSKRKKISPKQIAELLNARFPGKNINLGNFPSKELPVEEAVTKTLSLLGKGQEGRRDGWVVQPTGKPGQYWIMPEVALGCTNQSIGMQFTALFPLRRWDEMPDELREQISLEIQNRQGGYEFFSTYLQVKDDGNYEVTSFLKDKGIFLFVEASQTPEPAGNSSEPVRQAWTADILNKEIRGAVFERALQLLQ